MCITLLSIWQQKEHINRRRKRERERTVSVPDRAHLLARPFSSGVAEHLGLGSLSSVFPRALRLSRPSLSEVMQRGARHTTKGLIGILGGIPGYAVITPKKALRRSVDRHRAKRSIIGALRRSGALPVSLIVLVRPLPSPRDFPGEVRDLLSKIATHR